MLTGLLSLAVAYIGAEGAAFTAARFFAKPAANLASKAHGSGEIHRNLYWALDRIKKSSLNKQDKEKYDELVELYHGSDAFNIDLRSGV